MNVILEAHRTGSWRALTGGYAVETVEDWVTATQTGFQCCRPRASDRPGGAARQARGAFMRSRIRHDLACPHIGPAYMNSRTG